MEPQLYEVTATAGTLSDFVLIDQGPLTLHRDSAASGCQLKVGQMALSLPNACTVASCAGPFERSIQWMLPLGSDRICALLFYSEDEERRMRQALCCTGVLFDAADQEEPEEEQEQEAGEQAAAPSAAGKLSIKERAKLKAGKMVDRALDDGRTAQRIEAGGQAAAQGIIKGAQRLGERIHQAGDASKRRLAPSDKEFVAGPRTQAGLAATQRGAAATLRATETLRSACYYGIKTAARVTTDQVRQTSAFQRAMASSAGAGGEGEGSGGGGEGEGRGALAAEAGAAVVTACLSVMYASRRGARIVVDDTKEVVADVTEHRRGEAAGVAARQALDAVDSLGMAALNLSSLVTSPESLAFELSAEAADSTLSHKEWFSGEPVLSGMLKRRSNLTLRLGAPLLVLLRPRSLAAYMPETDAGGPHGGPEAPCVVVPVDDMERVSAVGDGGGGGAWQCQFEVRTRDQVLHRFAAADADARRGWLDALGAMIAEVEKAKGLDAQAALTAPGASGS